MTILNREQIDNYWRSPDLTVADLRDTARAYHDLRDAVLALCVNSGIRLNGEERLFAESDLRAVVARVERGDGHTLDRMEVSSATDAGTCPKCRHARHDRLGWCPNMASDNDCSCVVARVEMGES